MIEKFILTEGRDYLDLSTPCEHFRCRANTRKVNDSYCRKHQRFMEMTGEERRKLEAAKWNLEK